jgi:hypothetical protein
MSIEYLANTLINDFKRKSELFLDELDCVDENTDLTARQAAALKMIRQSGFFSDRFSKRC